jgi:hypothetical protein
MSVNRYSLPAEQPVQSKYVPLPYEEIMSGLRAKQSEQDKMEGLGELTKKLSGSFKDLNKVMVGYNAGTPIYQQTPFAGANKAYARNVQNKLEEFADRDLTDKKTKREFKSLVGEVNNYYTNGPGHHIHSLANEYEGLEKEYLQNKNSIKDFGSGTGVNLFETSHRLVNSDGIIDPVTGTPFKFGELKPIDYVDATKDINEILSPIKADSKKSAYYGNNAFKYSNGSEALDAYVGKDGSINYNGSGKIYNSLNNYLNTPGNEFHNQVYNQFKHDVLNGMNDGKGFEDYKKDASNRYLQQALFSHAYLKKENDVNFDSGLFGAGNSKSEDAGVGLVTRSTSQNYDPKKDVTSLSDLHKKLNGTGEGNDYGINGEIQKLETVLAKGGATKNMSTIYKGQLNILKSQKEYLNSLQDAAINKAVSKVDLKGIFGDIDDKDKKGIISTIRNGIKNGQDYNMIWERTKNLLDLDPGSSIAGEQLNKYKSVISQVANEINDNIINKYTSENGTVYSFDYKNNKKSETGKALSNLIAGMRTGSVDVLEADTDKPRDAKSIVSNKDIEGATFKHVMGQLAVDLELKDSDGKKDYTTVILSPKDQEYLRKAVGSAIYTDVTNSKANDNIKNAANQFADNLHGGAIHQELSTMEPNTSKTVYTPSGKPITVYKHEDEFGNEPFYTLEPVSNKSNKSNIRDFSQDNLVAALLKNK